MQDIYIHMYILKKKIRSMNQERIFFFFFLDIDIYIHIYTKDLDIP